MFVYLITNNINGKKYIGQTSRRLEDRWAEHIKPRGKPGCTYLWRAICKYGPEAFSIKPLVIVESKWEMDLYEAGMIKALNTKSPNGYNLTDGGDGVVGYTFTDEQRKKVSIGQIGRKMSEKSRQKLLERNKSNTFSLGIKMPEEHRLKLIKINTGSKMSEEVKKRMSVAHLGKKHTDETKRKLSQSAKRRYQKEAQQ